MGLIWGSLQVRKRVMLGPGIWNWECGVLEQVEMEFVVLGNMSMAPIDANISETK